MKFIDKIPFLIVAGLAWVVIVSSCANQGVPTGGPVDSFPPILISTQPTFRALNFKGKEIRFTFDEYINTSKILEKLVISPPLERRPIIISRGKGFGIRFNEDLDNDVTYRLDFQDGIVDNNEGNAIESFSFSFSTGSVYDSLRVSGYVLNSFNLDPIENTLVVLHRNLSDSAVFNIRPSYIAKTDKTGFFLIDNIAAGSYNIFAINDQNNNMRYNKGTEEIAFFDSLIIPFAEYIEEIDTVISGADTFLITGHTHFYPESVFLRHFIEDVSEQFLITYTRSSRYKCDFVFSKPVSDTFDVRLIDNETENWYLLEPNLEMDSITLWITDTTLINLDTLIMEVSYFQLDDLKQPVIQRDTLMLNFKAREDNKKSEENEDNEESEEGEESDENEENKVPPPPPVPQFAFKTNIGNPFELSSNVEITAPEPIFEFDTTGIHLYLTDDTLKTNLRYTIVQDSLHLRKYRIMYNWEVETSYTLEIDSAAFTNIYGITSSKITQAFKTREKNYYGQVILKFSEVKSPIIAQLLTSDGKETVLSSLSTSSNGTLTFNHVAPGKYIVKIIYDDNNNGKWDSGDFQKRLQPERVAYHNEVIIVRSNWDNEIIWEIDENPDYLKNVVDSDSETKK